MKESTPSRLHLEPYSLQNNGTMQIWCTAPSGATQFYRGVLFWIYNRIQIMYDSQFKRWDAQCFLRLNKIKIASSFFEAWGQWPNPLFVLPSRHCSFYIRIKNPVTENGLKHDKNTFLVTCPVSVSPPDVIACFMAIPAATPISAIRL